MRRKRKRHSSALAGIGAAGLAFVVLACSAKPVIKTPIPKLTASQTLTVAVLPFEDNGFVRSGAASGLGQTLADRISGDLSDHPGLTLIDRDAIERVLEELSLSSRGLTEAEGRLQLGKLLGAQYLIAGGYMAIGEGLRIDGRIIEVERGVVARAAAVEGRLPERKALETAFSKKVSNTLLAKIGAEVGNVPRQAPVTSQDHLQRGRFHERRNEMDKALKHYQRALFLDSGNQEARNRMEALLLKELE